MAAVRGCGGEEMMPSSSPKSRLKILCSHGGKILPRPADGHLKYVGGETRVVALPRNITYSELMKKLTALFDGDMVLKYQLIPEDLDALVSVRTDDDLRHMVAEYDRQENGGSPKLRAFMFPSSPIIVENQMASMDPQALEQRYIDAINGIIRSTSNVKLNPVNVNRPSFSISSTSSSSPKTLFPDKFTVENAMNQDSIFLNGYQTSRVLHMHTVGSSPNLCSLNDQNGNKNNHSNHHIHQHHHHYYHNRHSSQPPQDPYKSNVDENFASSPNSRVDSLRGLMGYGSDCYYPP